MSRLRVLVLMGGPSTEHDVSVVSGTGVVRAMDPEKYNIHPVLIETTTAAVTAILMKNSIA